MQKLIVNVETITAPPSSDFNAQSAGIRSLRINLMGASAAAAGRRSDSRFGPCMYTGLLDLETAFPVFYRERRTALATVHAAVGRPAPFQPGESAQSLSFRSVSMRAILCWKPSTFPYTHDPAAAVTETITDRKRCRC